MSGSCPTAPSRVTPTIEWNDGSSTQVTWEDTPKTPIQYEISWWHDKEDKETKEIFNTEYLLTNLKHGATYCFVVTPINNTVRGKPSKTVTFDAAPLAPINLEVVCARIMPEKAVFVTFEDVDTKQKSYRITLMETSTNEIKIQTSDTCSCMIDALKEGSEYTVHVEAIYKDLVSRKSQTKTIVTYPSQVQILKKEKTSPTSWCLCWKEVQSATKYEIIIKDQNSNYVTHTSLFPEFVFHNFERGSKYTVMVAAVNEAGKGKYSSKVEFQTDPEAPRNVLIKADDDNPEILHIKFEEPANKPLKYAITLIQNGEMISHRETKESSTTMPVQLSRLVKVSVQSLNGGNSESERMRESQEPDSNAEAENEEPQTSRCPPEQDMTKSEIVYSETITTCPEQVRRLQQVDRTGDSITIKWEEVPTATNYIVKIQEGIDCATYETEDNNYTLTNLHLDKKYFISVAAANKTGQGRYSGPLNFISAPQKAFDIEVENFQPSPSTSIQVTFKHSGEGCMYQIVAQALSCGKDVLVDTDKCFAVVGGLQPGGTYSVYITATKDDLTSKKSDCSKLIQTYPAKIEKPEVAMEDGMLKFTWEAPDIKPKSYIAVLKTNHECSETLIPDGTSFAVTNITPSTTYCFTVAANNDAGRGEMSEEGKHVTAPAAPVNIKVKNPEISPETSLLVEFEDPDPSRKKYRIAACLERDPTEAVVAHVESTNKKALVTGLMPGQTYKVFVVAICGDLQSEKAYFI